MFKAETSALGECFAARSRRGRRLGAPLNGEPEPPFTGPPGAVGDCPIQGGITWPLPGRPPGGTSGYGGEAAL